MHSTAAEIPPVSSSFHITTTTYIHTLSLSPFLTHFFTSSPSERPAAKHSTPSPSCSPLQQKRQPQEHTTGKKMHNTLVQFSSPLLRKQHKSPLLSLSLSLSVFVCVCVCSSSTSLRETRKYVSQYYWQQQKKKKKKKHPRGP
jgi:hypothetical protein